MGVTVNWRKTRQMVGSCQSGTCAVSSTNANETTSNFSEHVKTGLPARNRFFRDWRLDKVWARAEWASSNFAHRWSGYKPWCMANRLTTMLFLRDDARREFRRNFWEREAVLRLGRSPTDISRQQNKGLTMVRLEAVLKLLIIVIFHSFVEISVSSSEDEADQTEHYTAWPRDNDTILTEDFPWTSCNIVTGENCPGVMDVIRHICVPGDAKECEPSSELGNLSGRHIVLNLRPGLHRVGLRKVLDKPSERFIFFKYWLCNCTTLTIQGSRDLSTEVMASADAYESSHQFENWYEKCTSLVLNNALHPSWTIFAFYGGGKLIFKDLIFRSASEPRLRNFDRGSISTLNVPSVEIIRCRFNMDSMEGAVALIYTLDFANITATMQACEFDLHFFSHGMDSKIRRSEFSPPLVFGNLEIASTWLPGNVPSRHNQGNVTLQKCTFLENFISIPSK